MSRLKNSLNTEGKGGSTPKKDSEIGQGPKEFSFERRVTTTVVGRSYRELIVIQEDLIVKGENTGNRTCLTRDRKIWALRDLLGKAKRTKIIDLREG